MFNLGETCMKKSLVALAALAATGAFAQSTVSIDGILDAGYQSINYKGANNTVNGIAGNGSSTSQFNFRGSEDLGGGLKAEFRIETDFNMASTLGNTGAGSSINASSGTTATSINSTAGTFANGEIRVGLVGGFGRVDVGVVNYNSLTSFLTGQPFGTAIGSGFRGMFINDGQTASSVRAENALKYVSPSFNGLTVSLYKSNKQTKAQTLSGISSGATNGLISQANAFSTALGAYDQIGTQEVGVNYAAGPLAVSFSQLKQDSRDVGTVNSSSASTTGAMLTVNTLGANYTMGPAKLFGLYQTRKNNLTTAAGALDMQAMTVSATYTMGATTLMAQVGNLKQDAAVSTYAGKKTKLWGIGADYNLSKRTALYLRAESIDDQARAMNSGANPGQIVGSTNVATETDQKYTRTAIGLRHSF